MSETTTTRSGSRRSKTHGFAKLGQLMGSDPQAGVRFLEAGKALAEALHPEPSDDLREEALGVVLTAWVEGRLSEGLPEVP